MVCAMVQSPPAPGNCQNRLHAQFSKWWDHKLSRMISCNFGWLPFFPGWQSVPECPLALNFCCFNTTLRSWLVINCNEGLVLPAFSLHYVLLRKKKVEMLSLLVCVRIESYYLFCCNQLACQHRSESFHLFRKALISSN